MRVSERRRLEMYGPVTQPRALTGATGQQAHERFELPPQRGDGDAKDNRCPEQRALVHALSMAPIGRAPEMSVCGTPEKLPRDLLARERVTRKGEPRSRPRPAEYPIDRTPEDRAAGIVRVQVGRKGVRVDRTEELGEETTLPYLRP